MNKFEEFCGRPNLNGNNSHAFSEAGEKIYVAAYQLESLMREHLFELTHGRNYQHLVEGAIESQMIDKVKVFELLEKVADIKRFAVAVGSKATR